ncbi:Plant calmodulin-binding protein-like protein [Perilla frutescens var. hirtella]|nr:Plant calmodulin-binding protein-like protein [Perilla frutescens var. hirtella]
MVVPTMAKLVINTPMKLEKIKPKSDFQRRNSTGNADIIFSEPKPIPNYLRASIGSCHDLCKYGSRHDNVKPVARSNTNYRGKNVSGAKNAVPLSSRKQPSELKPKPPVKNLHSSQKQPISKSKNDLQISRNEAGKGMRMLNAGKNTINSSVKIPTAKKSSMKMISLSKIKKSAHVNSETGERSSCGDIAEKIIHVDEPNTNGDDQNVDLADQDGNRCNEMCSSPKQEQQMDSAAKSWNMAVKVGRAVMKENGASPRKQKIKREKALGIENGSKSLRRVVNDGHSIHDEKDESIRVALRHQATGGENTCPDSINTVIESTASRLAWMSRSKVKALVESFETLVNIQDSEIRVYTRSA